MMNHLFKQGQPTAKKLLLLHGTGGDEQSLVDIAGFLHAESTILSFRGAVEEEGMNRFFKRNGLNQFDIPSLEAETDKLLQAIKKISEEAEIALADWIIVGYSNGANIAAHALLERETELQQAILFHPMSLGVDTQKFSLADKKIWLSYSQNDPIVPEKSARQLVQQFESRGAVVQVANFTSGHQITMEELESAKEWLNKK